MVMQLMKFDSPDPRSINRDSVRDTRTHSVTLGQATVTSSLLMRIYCRLVVLNARLQPRGRATSPPVQGSLLDHTRSVLLTHTLSLPSSRPPFRPSWQSRERKEATEDGAREVEAASPRGVLQLSAVCCLRHAGSVGLDSRLSSASLSVCLSLSLSLWHSISLTSGCLSHSCSLPT